MIEIEPRLRLQPVCPYIDHVQDGSDMELLVEWRIKSQIGSGETEQCEGWSWTVLLQMDESAG